MQTKDVSITVNTTNIILYCIVLHCIVLQTKDVSTTVNKH